MRKANKWFVLFMLIIFILQSLLMPTFITAEGKALMLQMYNKDIEDTSNTISPNYRLINIGNTPIDLKDVKLRYYYMTGGDNNQNFWCDWSTVGTANIRGIIIPNANRKRGADTYVEISFSDSAGILEIGGEVEIMTRISRDKWGNYIQSDDYSFNGSSINYTDWDRVTVYIGNELVWGIEPQEPFEEILATKIQMFNTIRSNSSNSISPHFKLHNTGTIPFELKDVSIRYYYTIDDNTSQSFYCDWSDIGSNNVIGRFMTIPYNAQDTDYYLEISFTDWAGTLIPGDDIEIQTRFNKTDWSSYNQFDDYSFNSTNSDYADWSSIDVYIKGKLVWGGGLLFGVPENFTFTSSEDSINISWDSVEGATGYEIEIDGDVINNGANTTYNHTDLNPGTSHIYRVRATNPIMNGGWTDTKILWTLPDIPKNFASSSVATEKGNTIILTWDTVEGATGYDVEVQGVPVDNGSNTTFIQDGLNPNLQQIYRIRAKNSSGVGKWSDVIAESTLSATPSNLGYTSTDTEIRLYWNIVAGATGYEVEVNGETIVSVSDNIFLHSGLSPFTKYFFRVRSINDSGVSNWSELFNTSTLLSVPSNLKVVVAPVDEMIITWDSVSNATGYDLEINGVITEIGVATQYINKDILPNTEYSYRVRARNGGAVSKWSEEITRRTFTGVPANITAKASTTEIVVSWEPVTGANGYELEIDGEIIDTGMYITYNHSGLEPYSMHSYRVRARNVDGASQWSELVMMWTKLGIPQNLQVITTTASISLTWDVVEGADGYDVMVDGMVIDNGANTSYFHSDLEPNSTHIYRVRAKKSVTQSEASQDYGDITGEWSEALIVLSALGVPGNIVATANSSEIILTWDEVLGATGYEIEADGTLVDIGRETIFIHIELLPNTLHTYRIRAKNASSIGEWSEIIIKKTAYGAPANFRAEATTTEITLTWDSIGETDGVLYELEIDGEIINDIKETRYVHKGLMPNTKHIYRVRAISGEAISEWSNRLDQITNPEIEVSIAKDNMFNFIIAVPRRPGVESRNIIVTYNPDDVEVMDLYATTRKADLDDGIIEGTNIAVQKLDKGSIKYTVPDMDKTIVIIIKFISKTNSASKVTYSIK